MMKTNVLKSGILFALMLISSLVQSQTDNRKITLDDVLKSRKFSARGFSGAQPLKDGEHFCQVKKDSLNVYEYKTGKYVSTVVTSGELIPEGDTVPLPVYGYQFSPDESKILFAKDEEAIYRWSSKAFYYVFDIATRRLTPVSDKGKQRLAVISPDGTKIAYVRDNNLFVKELPVPTQTAPSEETQITFDGKMNEIINGAPDWVYEEEFGFAQAFCWSPDSKKIAYYRFDETRVKEYTLDYYGEIYPEQYKYKYPKPGEDNSLVNIFITNLVTGDLLKVDIGEETDIYIPRIKWTENPEILALYRLNRHQNKLDLLFADAATGKTHVAYSEENKYYIEINDDWIFLKNGKQFIISSEKDGYMHLYLYNMDGSPVCQITKGNWEVTGFLGVDEEKQLVYAVTTMNSPMDRSLVSVSLDGKKLTLLTPGPGTHSVSVTPGFRYFIDSYSDINTPPVITIYDRKWKPVREVENNEKLKTTIAEAGFGKTDFFSFTTDDGITLNGWMLKPAGFDAARKYPVLVTIYGGPGSQTVLNKWGAVSSWDQLLAQNGIILVSIDNRGTGGRGEEFKKCTYLELGKYETIDQIEGAKYLGSLPFVDKDRIGMWGWSFGGYLTLSSLTKGADWFSMGVAVAPVTNWKYYDNIYTERFMRTPKENESGYEDNSPINHAAGLKGKLLMIHGMADDNVHPQNSYDFVTALVAADKQFEQQLYPNSNHGIYTGKNTTFHLYSRMTGFILKNLRAGE